ncbi:MAG: helix-turn-helix domain-containing protein [Proteobacteria bacterium]|nr:helix-turn-helix domain-containing protein [Pseudomonadota bacterium]
MTVQIIEIGGHEMAVLPVAEYRRLIDAVEDRADVAAAEKAELARVSGEEYLPAEFVDRLLAGENALRVWRQFRGLTAIKLSALSGIDQSRISELENDKAQGKPSTWRALADALGVMVDDILPLRDEAIG